MQKPFVAASLLSACLCCQLQAEQQGLDYTEISFDELLTLDVTSVSKRSEKLSTAAAAIYVVTQQEIRRSGATSIPEALRMVPGLDVSKIDANKWSIGIRGFSDRFANKILVMLDGRSVYTPTFSGVYWELLDYPLQDIERIEVIRGPGATLWGTNAVNGVINIITKEARNTQGGMLRLAAGDELAHLAAFRTGTTLSDNLAARAYAKSRENRGAVARSGKSQDNDGQHNQAGFRVDWQQSVKHWLSLQGDLFHSDIGQEHQRPGMAEQGYLPYLSISRAKTDGANLNLKWNQILSLDSEFSAHLSVDYYDRDEIKYDDQRTTWDLDLSYQTAWLEQHQLIFGGGFRWSTNRLGARELLIATQSCNQKTRVWNLFAQDQISLDDQQLSLTLGVKLEGSDDFDTELQPNLRFSWSPTSSTTLWGAISRAVRTPSRAEKDATLLLNTYPPAAITPELSLPAFVILNASDDYQSELLDAYELGLRYQVSSNWWFDISSFYNHYDQLRSYALRPVLITPSEPSSELVIPLSLGNQYKARTKGIELLTDWQAHAGLHFRLSYSYLDVNQYDDGSLSLPTVYGGYTNQLIEDRAPQQQASLWASLDLTPTLELDLQLRFADKRPWSPELSGGVDAYTNLDLNLGWMVNQQLSLSLTGRNLLHDQQEEFVIESWPEISAIERSIALTMRLNW